MLKVRTATFTFSHVLRTRGVSAKEHTHTDLGTRRDASPVSSSPPSDSSADALAPSKERRSLEFMPRGRRKLDVQRKSEARGMEVRIARVKSD
jgi:hypothetical protein